MTLFHIGLDIHSKHITACVLGEAGHVFHRSRVRGPEEVLRILRGLPDRFEVCYEARRGYGHYHDLLRPLAARVLVAHPGQLRLIFRSKDKNDRNDAERLAKPLYLGATPTVHVPSLEVRTWRELINCRSQGIAKRTRPSSPGPGSPGGAKQARSDGSHLRSGAGLRLHPVARQGAVRRRWCEGGQPHTASRRAAWAADAQWTSGESRARLAPALIEAPSWMPDQSALGRMTRRSSRQGILIWPRRRGPIASSWASLKKRRN
jgi:hypothetical protein